MWTATTNCLLFFREGSASHAWTAPATSQLSWHPVCSSSHCHHGTCLRSGTKKALLGCPKHRLTLTATSSSATTSLSNTLIYSRSLITVLILYIYNKLHNNVGSCCFYCFHRNKSQNKSLNPFKFTGKFKSSQMI